MTQEISRERSGPRVFWRSLEEYADPSAVEAPGSDVVKATIGADELSRVDRRGFLTLSGAIGALAGLEGCIRRPVEKIMPYSESPEQMNPGGVLHYATVSGRGGEALGLLVTSRDGRPTKVEGNPEHPASLGKTDVWAQAAILDLYDADRARTPTAGGKPSTWGALDAFLGARLDALAAKQGAGLRVLSGPTDSPTFQRLREKVRQRFPQAQFHTWAPIGDANARAGAKLAFGRPLVVDPRFDAAKVILAIDSDFLLTEPGSVVAGLRFAQSRRMASAKDERSRLYAVEPTLSVTGANADHRLPLPARAVGRYLAALAAELSTKHGVDLGPLGGALGGTTIEGVPPAWIEAVAKDLAARRGEALVVVGSRQPAAVHALAHAINQGLGAAGRTVGYFDAPDPDRSDPFQDLRALAADMESGRVDTLVVLGANPVYDAPPDTGFVAALTKVPNSICFGAYLDETGEKCAWHAPRAHELETWGDHAGRSGHYAVQQPMIAPLWDGRSDIEVLGRLAGEADASGFALVRTTGKLRGIGDDVAWSGVVQLGVDPGSGANLLGAIPVNGADVGASLRAVLDAATGDGPEAVFLADNKILAGDYANNAWLLEMPDPITRIVWDNAALFAPETAKALGIENGDVVRLSRGDASVEIPAWIQPGHAPNSIGLPLGWGRTRAGRHGTGKGFDVSSLRTIESPYAVGGVKVERLGRTYRIAQTQEHDRMEERPIAVEATVDEYKETPNFGQFASPDPATGALWPRGGGQLDYTQGHQWGMSIDLNACTGCSACVVACQAENNIPVVGKAQVARGREMSWIRIDRYYLGEAASPDVSFQPVACQHCEDAPCENVCPVAATAHSPEGLNDIAYNRCIGTRYCMNNCPYKVRRFNYFNFNLDIPETEQMRFNPDVTVRFRGVIEKCSYCVQRIQASKIAARREDRPLKDGDVRTACQQACPSQAIVFGDINDPNSAVSQANAIDRDYALLAEVGTRPRTRYLGKVRNPNPEMGT